MNCEYPPHLNPEKFVIAPGGEWSVPVPGWWLVHVHSGSGYILAHGGGDPLERHATLRISPSWAGTLRASQLSALELRAVRFDCSRLLSLITPVEEQFFDRAQNDPQFSFCSFAPIHRLSQAACELFQSTAVNLAFRVNALSLFLATLDPQFTDQACGPHENPADATRRVKRLLAQTPSADLISLDLPDLVRRANCTPRHLRRIFREVLGVSFREKQTQLRLERAAQLLSRSEKKIVDVAFESGFGSVSLFNAVFKRRFRIPPRQWRDSVRRAKPGVSVRE